MYWLLTWCSNLSEFLLMNPLHTGAMAKDNMLGPSSYKRCRLPRPLHCIYDAMQLLANQ